MRDQIEITERRAIEGRVANFESQIQSANRELQRLELARESSELMLRKLREQLSGNAPYANRVIELKKRAEYPTSSSQLDTESMGGQLWEAINRVRMVAHNIENDLSRDSVKTRGQFLKDRDVDASEAVAEFASIVQQVPGHIEVQQQKIESLQAELEHARVPLEQSS